MMKELLDEDLQEQNPKWWQGFFLFFYWKVYAISFLAAMGILLMLFMRNTHGSDFDAVLAILILWGIMLNLFRQASKSFFVGFVLSFVLIFFVFLEYTPSFVAWLHGVNFRDVTRWKWSHYELVFGHNFFSFNLNDAVFGRRDLLTTLLESTEWFIFYAFLTVITTEILHLFKVVYLNNSTKE